MNRLNAGNRKVEMADRQPLDNNTTCVKSDAVHTHYIDITDESRRACLDKGMTLSFFCQADKRPFTISANAPHPIVMPGSTDYGDCFVSGWFEV